MSDLVSYMRSVVKMRQDHAVGGYYYSGMEDFVLREGRSFPWRKLPDDVWIGEYGNCFQNALDLAMENPGYRYCEGFATSMIPVHHAWVVGIDGFVVDNTWTEARHQEYPQEYHGVLMTVEFVMEHVERKGTYGVMDDWENGWPILRVKWEG